MKKVRLLLLLSSVLYVSATANCYGFSVHKSAININRNEELNYSRIDEIIKLSSKQFSKATGKKMSLWNKLIFKLVKMKMKHDLKKNPNLQIADYIISKRKASALGIVGWVLIGLVALLFILLIVAGIALKK